MPNGGGCRIAPIRLSWLGSKDAAVTVAAAMNYIRRRPFRLAWPFLPTMM